MEKDMKIPVLVTALLVILLGAAGAGAASISGGNIVTVTNPLDAAALVYVSGYEVTPAVLYSGETGTVTIHVTNAANTSVAVSQPDLMEPHIEVVNKGAFATATSIGPGETVDYNFVVHTDGRDGTYFPLFTVSTTIYGASAIHSQIKLKIDSTDVRTSIASKPETFSLSKKDTVNVSVVNPRSGDITDVLVVPEADGAEVFPQEAYIGTIKAGGCVQVPFDITPEKTSGVTFHVNFNNGDNAHTSEVVLPLALGDDKMGAQMVVNNIESTNAGNVITLKGDVTNNGLTAAKSVLVTVGSPGSPVNPNPVYAIGNLEPDDFSSFEVTYTANGPGAVPVIVSFKDTDGNVFSSKFSYNANTNGTAFGGGSYGAVAGGQSGSPSGSQFNRRGGGMFGSFGSGFNQLPVTEIGILLVAVIAIGIAWRKGLLTRLRDRFRRKPEPEDEIREQ